MQNLLMNFKDDARIASWAREGVAVSAKTGIIPGNSDQAFAPQSNASRAKA
ncbi:S-layer homology domain-containing protein [Desulforamulus ruminis]|uniref:S-layer homology domain-containing protein n=1 Tax=Desulforamulus ruminis TaxID=1564 RepID=UPI0009DB345A